MCIMPDVTFSVGARRYTLRCAPGQEDHLLQIAASLDARVQPLAEVARNTDDRKLLVMAAIALLDEMAAANRGSDGRGGAAIGDAEAVQRDMEILRGDVEALRNENAALREDNAALRAWADGMAARLTALSGALGALAEEPPAD